MKRFNLFILALLVTLSLPLPVTQAQRKAVKPAPKPAAAPEIDLAHGNVAAVTAAQLKDFLMFIAADEMEGRDTPSRGLDLAAKFIAFNLSRWNVKPAGDEGTYFQRFNIKRNQLDTQQTRVELNGQSFALGTDFIARLNIGAARGKLVYAGHGLVVKAKNVDAYQGVDVKDKIVIVADGAFPKGVQPQDLRGKLGADYDKAANYARTHGAVGLIVVPGPGILANWQRVHSFTLNTQPQLDEAEPRADSSAKELPAIYASEKLLTAIFQDEKLDVAAVLKQAATGEFTAAFDLNASKEANFNIVGKSEILPTQNVVAMLEGSDPTLKNEYVAIGAHYDHVGIRLPTEEGRNDTWSRYKAFLTAAGKLGGQDMLFNGADDDGSGTTAMLAIAEALVKGPRPKRSVLFVWHAGEEHGLWGSDYITDHPPVPLPQIIAQLNIDMIGRSKPEGDTNNANRNLTGPDEIYVIGSKMMSTELGEVSEAVNKSFLNLKLNYKYDEPNDPERFFFRSDHYNYARKGIPIIFYFDGVHEAYHRPADAPDKIDYAKLEKVTRTILATAWELLNRASRPKVDKQLPAALLRD